MSVFNQQTRSTERQPTPSVDTANDNPAAQVPTDQKPDVVARPAVRLGKTLVFKGDLSVAEEVLLLGTVEGSFECTDALTIGISGRVIGDIRGRTITIKGTVQGDIRASESVAIIPGAVVTGEVEAPRITIVEGAQFNGSVKMTKADGEDLKEAAPVSNPNGTPPSSEAVEQLLGLLNQRLKS
jgi:cytoskeletal protein CcmA (bactofilin family)